MKIIKNSILLSSMLFFALGIHSKDAFDKHFIPSAQTASVVGNWALWHNPAGLAFMGGGESSLAYLFEWNKIQNRSHGGGNAAVNLWHAITIAGGLSARVVTDNPSSPRLAVI